MEKISAFQIFLILSLIFIAFSVAVMLIFSIRKATVISVKNFILLYSIFTAGVVLFVYCFEPASFMRWDLLEHYKELDNIRNIGWRYCVYDSQYSNLYVCMVYFFLIAQIGNYHLLPAIPVLTEMLVFLYIFMDQAKLQYGETIPIRKATLVIYTWFCSFGFLLAVSGVRCVWGIALGFLGLYLEYYKREKRILGLLLVLMGILIHPAVIIVVAVRVVLIIPYKKTVLVAMLVFVMLGTKVLAVVVTVIPISFLQYAAQLMYKYWDGMMVFQWLTYVTNSTRSIYLCYVCITVFQMYLLQKIRTVFKKNPEAGQVSDNAKLVNLSYTILIFQIAGLFNYLFTERIMYITAYNFILLVPLYVKYAKKNEIDTIFTFALVGVLAWLVFFNDIYRLIVNYSGVYFLAM